MMIMARKILFYKTIASCSKGQGMLALIPNNARPKYIEILKKPLIENFSPPPPPINVKVSSSGLMQDFISPTE